MTGSYACSDDARRRGDDRAGTAVTSQSWLLIEHPGPWDIDAFAGSGIAFSVRAQITAAVRAAGARLLLIRRPGRQQQPAAARAWAVVDNRRDVADVWGTWRRDDELLATVDPLTSPSPSDGPDKQTLLLVCAHGRHDTCCAVRGRPVAAALQQQWPEETWECSHVGGCRFAGNVIVLPSDAYYGDLDPVSAVRVVGEHLAGRVDADHLRGLGTEPRVAQVAIVRAHRDFGPAPADAVVSAGVEQLDEATWRVRLRGSGSVPASLVAVVRSHPQAPALLTCRAPRATSATGYHVENLEPV